MNANPMVLEHCIDRDINGFAAVMKDDSSPLSLYGLRPGSKVLLLGNRPNVSFLYPRKVFLYGFLIVR